MRFPIRPSLLISIRLGLGPLLVLFACGGEDAGVDASASAVDAGHLDASVSTDAAGDANTTPDAARDANTSSDATQDATTPVGATCGGFAGLTCEAGEFCNYELAAGGQGCDGELSDAAGTCQPLPEACDFQYNPVCGCDGETYGNQCAAHASGVSVARPGECGQPKATSCDVRPLACRIATPVCDEGEVPSILGSCYGPCVAIDECDCDGADACPQPEIYTCHLSAGRCGPYVN